MELRTAVWGKWNRHSSHYEETKTLYKIRNSVDQHLKESSLTFNEKQFLKDIKSWERAQDEVTKLLIKELELRKVSIIGDGGIRWDSIYDIAKIFRECGGFADLTRIPETNHFHRQPETDGAALNLESPLPSLIQDLSFVKSCTSKTIAICIPGPYSLTRQTKIVNNASFEKVAKFYAETLNKQVKLLLENGADIVRVEDPQILSRPQDFDLFKELAMILAKEVDQLKIAFATWFGDICDLPEYFELPFGIFCLDLVENGIRSLKTLNKFPKNKILVAGILDAQHIWDRPVKGEGSLTIEKIINYILNYVEPDRLILGTNTDLHFLPWDEALRKVEKLVYIANSCNPTSPKRTVFVAEPLEKQTKIKLPDRKPSNKKLNLTTRHPTFPTSAVGSYPQNQEIRNARVKLKKGDINETTYRAIIDHHTKRWMKFQEEIDLTVPVSGEFLRADMALYFGLKLGGRKGDFIPSYENRRYEPIIYDRTIDELNTSMLKDDFLFVQSLTDRIIKETITGPVTMAEWAIINNERYYNDRLAFRLDIAKAIRKEIGFLKDAGVKVLQVDEPALTTKMRMLEWDLQAIYETVCGFEESMYLILHICYSDMEALEVALPHILELPFHQIHMEVKNREEKMIRLIEKYGEKFSKKDIGLGIIDVHKDRIEKTEEIIECVEKMLKIFKPSQIWLTPDCGLKDRSDEIAMAKMRVMTETAKICREKFA